MADAAVLEEAVSDEDRLLKREQVERRYGSFRVERDNRDYCPLRDYCAYATSYNGSVCNQDWYGHVLCQTFRNSFDDGK